MCKNRKSTTKKPAQTGYNFLDMIAKQLVKPLPTMQDRTNTWEQQILQVSQNPSRYLRTRGTTYTETQIMLARLRNTPLFHYVNTALDSVVERVDILVDFNPSRRIMEHFGVKPDTRLLTIPGYGPISGKDIAEYFKGGFASLYGQDKGLQRRPINQWRAAFQQEMIRGRPSNWGRIADNTLIYGGARNPRVFAINYVTALVVGCAYWWFTQSDTPAKTIIPIPPIDPPHPTPTPKPFFDDSVRQKANRLMGFAPQWRTKDHLRFDYLFSQAASVRCNRCTTHYVWDWDEAMQIIFFHPQRFEMVFPCPNCMTIDPIRTLLYPPSCLVRPISVPLVRGVLNGHF